VGVFILEVGGVIKLHVFSYDMGAVENNLSNIFSFVLVL
jgi:hypothetical protein